MSTAEWWCQRTFSYVPNETRWTVWDGEGDYDVAIIVHDKRTAQRIVRLGNLWEPLGRFAIWWIRVWLT